MSEEIWKDIKGYEGLYQVSNLGRIKSLERRCKARWYTRKVPEKIYSPALDTYGYPIVSLHKDGKRKRLQFINWLQMLFLKSRTVAILLITLTKISRTIVLKILNGVLFKKTMLMERE